MSINPDPTFCNEREHSDALVTRDVSFDDWNTIPWIVCMNCDLAIYKLPPHNRHDTGAGSGQKRLDEFDGDRA